MREKKISLILFVSALALIVMAVIAESVYLSDFEYRLHTKRVNRAISEKEKVLDNCMTGLRLIFARGGSPQSVAESAIFSTAEKNHITLLYYIDGRLIYWSDNTFDVPIMLDNALYSKPIVFIRNGWFVPGTIGAGNEKIIGLLRVRTDYGFENELVTSGFDKEFRLPENTGISTDQSPEGYNVYNRNGDFLFSLKFPEDKSNTYLIIFPLVLWLASFIALIAFSLELNKILVRAGKKIPAAALLFLSFSVLYLLLLISGKPEIVNRTELFSPYTFSMGNIFPSLGHLACFSILLAVLCLNLHKNIPSSLVRSGSAVKDFLMLTLLFSVAALALSFIHKVFTGLVSESGINYEIYKVLKISIFTIAGYVSVVLMMSLPLLIIHRTCMIFRESEPGLKIPAALLALLIIAALGGGDLWPVLSLALLFSGLVILACASIVRNISAFNLLVIFSLLFGLYSLFVVTVFSERKTNENIKVQTVSFITDHDPVAEHLLLDIWPEINADTVLDTLMDVDYFERRDYNNLLTYLREKYFSGYWGNFSFSIFLCGSEQSIEVGTDSRVTENNCFSFFDERIKRYGQVLTGTGFYFIDNQGGRSNYLGRLFFSGRNGTTNGLFIELFSDVNVFQPGYSELLLDRKFRGYAGLKDYSFAKYINGKIVLRNGVYPYSKNDESYIGQVSEYRLFREDGHIHSLYRNGNATIIISRPVPGAGNIVISFAYLFIFIFIITNLFLLFMKPPAIGNVISLNFRQKLQASFTGILLVSFILTGVVVAYLTIRQYKTEHNNNIREKLGSIYMELESRLASEKFLSPEWSNSNFISLNELLIDLSNVFNTDINLYDMTGFLLATSRPEIFYRDLSARRMNIMAYMNLNDLKRSEYIQNERLGELEYISAYVPFYNSENRVLAYVNLPYFRMQSLLARQISNLVVAVINFTLLLILFSMSFAVFISGRLTAPLSMLSRGLASVELGKKSKQLNYSGNDEIGELVRQYNQMLDELDESARKLANSEREYAWREMAKQIAHEIKNPLTPMKLNVQQLLKSWKDGVPGFEKRLEAFSKNQIEYIDNLSSIASAFSSFAKLPGSNPVIIDICEQMKLTLELFRNTANINFRVRWPQNSKLFIFADREHLNGIFSNLLKNSIQAIPHDREGLIKVIVETTGDKVLISVTDNGTGIPAEVQKKLFTPNFTTKSSGMGLGLSIVKKYVEGANGRIWFESETGQGTTFHVEFPLMYSVEKPGTAV
jgi:signal transduction histidine kinase